MKKIILAFYCILITSISSSQILYNAEINTNPKGEWFVINYLGFATLETEDTFKTNAAIYGGMIGKEFLVSKRFSLVTGLEHLLLRSDLTLENKQQYFSHNFLQVPVMARLSTKGKTEPSVFFEFGLYGAYLYQVTVENMALGEKSKDNEPGFNFGLSSQIGFRYKIAENFSIQLGFKSQGELFQSYKDTKPEVSLSEVYMLQLGLGFQL